MEKISSLFKRDTIFFIDEEKVCTDREVLQIIGKLLLEKGYVKESFGNGYNSVMIDAADLPLEENIKAVKTVVDYAHARNVHVEAEMPILQSV